MSQYEEGTYAQSPVYAEPVSMDQIRLNENEINDMKKILGYRQTLRFVSIIDAVMCLMNGLVIWPLLFIMVMPIMGYYGAKSYSSGRVKLYMLYSLLILAGRCVQLYYFHDYDAEIVFFILSIFIQTWILRISFCFNKLIDNPTIRERIINTYLKTQYHLVAAHDQWDRQYLW
tara:strand:+ start:573 stop:1091 length:519 start_codon:yes stop_codon:yes gene_type:complete